MYLYINIQASKTEVPLLKCFRGIIGQELVLLMQTSDVHYGVLYITCGWECSHVLTVIHHFKGSFCDFLLFFRDTHGGHSPQPIVTQNGLNDAVEGKNVPFGVKIETFCTI